ncbi:MAG TPA: hypothetical protein VF760_12140, partial [Xanthobacteraceae bacterium]
MDYLRKCYRGKARIFVDGQPVIVGIAWYWADPDAPVFPFAHCWGSHVYNSYLQFDTGQPEELVYKAWQKDPTNPGFRAGCFLGDREWWTTGNIPSAAIAAAAASYCPGCFQPAGRPVEASGGLTLAGVAGVAVGRPVEAAGGLILAGQAPAGELLGVEAIGGLVLGGLAGAGLGIPAQPAGGLLVAGQAVAGEQLVVEASGALLLAGQASGGELFAVEASGGLVVA